MTALGGAAPEGAKGQQHEGHAENAGGKLCDLRARMLDGGVDPQHQALGRRRTGLGQQRAQREPIDHEEVAEDREERADQDPGEGQGPGDWSI